MQTCHNFVVVSVFFCENLYQSVSFFDASMYLDTFHEIRIAMQFAKKLVSSKLELYVTWRDCR